MTVGDIPSNVSDALMGVGGGLSEIKLTSCQEPSKAWFLSSFAWQAVQFCPTLQAPGGEYAI